MIQNLQDYESVYLYELHRQEKLLVNSHFREVTSLYIIELSLTLLSCFPVGQALIFA